MLLIQIILSLFTPRVLLVYVTSLYAYGELTCPMVLLMLLAIYIDLS